MIIISNNPINENVILNEYTEDGIEKEIASKILKSEEKYEYKTLDELKFELKLRKEIINAAKELYKSRMDFEVFRKSRCNPDYWKRTNEGGFVLKEGVNPSDAINDIFIQGNLYGTECATAMIIVYYKALLGVYGEQLFNKTFNKIHLMNWHYIDKNLRDVGIMKKVNDFLPGDRRYFNNPDVNPLTPEWQGENVIDLSNGRYYGHGIGIYPAETILNALNENRKEDAEESAYLMDTAGRPNFKRLFDIYSQG